MVYHQYIITAPSVQVHHQYTISMLSAYYQYIVSTPTLTKCSSIFGREHHFNTGPLYRGSSKYGYTQGHNRTFPGSSVLRLSEPNNKFYMNTECVNVTNYFGAIIHQFLRELSMMVTEVVLGEMSNNGGAAPYSEAVRFRLLVPCKTMSVTAASCRQWVRSVLLNGPTTAKDALSLPISLKPDDGRIVILLIRYYTKFTRSMRSCDARDHVMQEIM